MYLVIEAEVLYRKGTDMHAVIHAGSMIVCSREDLIAQALKADGIYRHVRWWLADGVVFELCSDRTFMECSDELTVQNSPEDFLSAYSEGLRNASEARVIRLANQNHGVEEYRRHVKPEDLNRSAHVPSD